MNDNRLSALYRQLTARTAGPVSLDADTLAAAATGALPADRREAVASRLAVSPAEAELVRMLAVLEDDSEALAGDLARVARTHGRRQGRRGRHQAAPARPLAAPLRWAGMAACLMAVLGLWSAQRMEPGIGPGTSAQAGYKADRIFTTKDSIFAWSNGEGVAQTQTERSDRLFDSAFNGS